MPEDKRVIVLTKFFKDKNSSLVSHTAYFIQTAATYGLDWTLMTAISSTESGFGKSMPHGSNNPFGLGGTHLMRFSSVDEAIEY